VIHEQAWERLPDLLGSHDEARVLAHVAGCHACQRQLFLLGRVDRLLRQAQPKKNGRPARARLAGIRAVAPLAAVGAVVAVALVFVLPGSPDGRGFVLRTADGHAVGRATLVRADRSNVEVSLVARVMPRDGSDQFLLWAQSEDGVNATTVGRFMVDRRGECRAHFNLPANHRWTRFWLSPSSDPALVVAAT
jgi:hypothetical protein